MPNKYDPAYMNLFTHRYLDSLVYNFWLQTLYKLKIRYAFLVHLWVNKPWWMRTEIHKIGNTKYDDINGL